jgi:hypothetical protein
LYKLQLNAQIIYFQALNKLLKFFSKKILTSVSSYDKFIFVDKTAEQYNMEVYPSLAEGIGLENRQAGNTARGFESLYLLHF